MLHDSPVMMVMADHPMHTAGPVMAPQPPTRPAMQLISSCSGRVWCRLWPLRLFYVLLSVGLLRHNIRVLWSGLPGSMGAVRLITHTHPSPNTNTHSTTHAQAQLVQHRRVPTFRPDLIQHHVK